MPDLDAPSSASRSIEQAVASVGVKSIDAFYFLLEGLHHAACQAHGPTPKIAVGDASRHITGRQLCEGLREIAVARWGPMTTAVLATWGIHRTLDFGRVVYALIEAGHFQKTERDTLDDFADIYDFRKAFGTEYRMNLPGTIR